MSRVLSSAVLAVTLAATCAHFPNDAHASDSDEQTQAESWTEPSSIMNDGDLDVGDSSTLLSALTTALEPTIDTTSEVASLDYADVARTAQVETVVEEALSHVGSRYAMGAMGPNAFDCSGLVKYVFDTMLGMDLPRTTYSQVNLGTEVPLSEAQRGDLVFWGSRTSPHHVGICLGDGTYVHAATYGKGVRVDTFDYYKPSFAKRVL